MWECDCCGHLNPLDKDQCENCHARREQLDFEIDEEQELHGYPSSAIQDEPDEET